MLVLKKKELSLKLPEFLQKTYRGRALAILRPDGKPGTMTLTVKAEGIPEETTEILVR